MSRRYSTRWRRGSGFASADPAVDGRAQADGLAPPRVTGVMGQDALLQAGFAELQAACALPGRIVLLTGVAGPVSELLCAELRSRRKPPLVTVDGGNALHDGQASLLAAVLTAYGFQVESNIRSQVMAELIAHHAGDPTQVGRRCLVVIHAAERLGFRDLEALLLLVHGSALTLLLAGSDRVIARVAQVARQSSLSWQEVRFPDLSVTDLRAYLQQRDGQPQTAGLMGEQASQVGSMRIAEQQHRRRRRRSRPIENPLDGLVGSVRAFLRNLVRPEGESRGPLGFPRRHLMALGMLVVALLVVYVIGRFAGAPNRAEPVQRVTTIATPALPAAQSPAAAAGAGASDADADAARSPAARPVPAPGAEPAPAEPAPIIARPQSEPAPLPAPRVPPPAAPPPAAPPPAAPAPVPAPPAAAPVAPVSRPAASGSPRGADWIMAQPGSHFTLQLVSLSSAERAQAYLAQQPDPGAFAVYRLLRNGQIFHAVVYGSYASRADAERAAGRLPASVGNVQPWVRQFSQVQDSVRTALQQ